MARFSKRKLKAYRKQYYSSNAKKALKLKGLNNKCNTDVRKQSNRIMRRYNALHASTIKAAKNDAYASNPTLQKDCEAKVHL